MPNLKEVLADKTKYPDNLVWNLSDGTAVTLAMLRGLSDETQSAITKREKDLEAERLKLQAQNDELKKAQLNTANAYAAVQAAETAIKAGRFDDPAVKALFGTTPIPGVVNNTNDPFSVLTNMEKDTLLGPLVAVIKSVRAEALEAQKQAANLVEVNKAMANNYLNGVLEDRYDRLVPADKQDKISLKSLIEDAVRNREFSSDSTPDIRKAYRRAVAGDEAVAREAKIREDERKKVMEELASKGGSGHDAIFVGQPTNFGLDVHNRTGAAPKAFKNLDEAFAAAEKDSSIWNQVDGKVA